MAYRKINLTAYNSKTSSIVDFYYDTEKKNFTNKSNNTLIKRVTSKLIKDVTEVVRTFCINNKLDMMSLEIIESKFTKYNNITVEPLRRLV